jgi:outer membrane lipoprotein-sorting protein
MSDQQPATTTNTSRARLLRWGVPAGVLAVALVAPATGRILSANAAPSLPSRTPAQLLVDLQTARVDGMSGTVVQHSDLGLPQLPGLGAAGAPNSGSSSLTSLISGTHTMRVWYSGPDKARLALLGTLGESDVVLNNHDLWTWSSDQKTAQHRQLPADTEGAPESKQKPGQHPELPTTPQAAADQALAAITPTTKVGTAENATVAGRPAYELVIAPKDTRSLVHEVRIAIDSATKVPLRFQAFAAGKPDPAFEVGFTQVSFQRPGNEQFRFTPPPGTKVTESTTGAPREKAGTKAKSDKADKAQGGQPTVIGTGWTSVVVAKAPSAMPSTAEAPQGAPDVNRILQNLPRVRGTWGSGRLLKSSLFSVLLTDDGRVLAGAVAPELLYAAAAAK